MEFRQNYEPLLDTLCEAYRIILKLLESANQCDALIMKLSGKDRANSIYVCNLITQKEQLIDQLDSTSMYAEQINHKLTAIMKNHPEICCHPMYQHLEDLQKLACYRMDTLLNKEDVNNTQVIDYLNNCMESYELDIKIGEIPPEKRRIFMVVPEKKQ